MEAVPACPMHGRVRSMFVALKILIAVSVVTCTSAFAVSICPNVDTMLPPYQDTADGLDLAFWFDDFVSYPRDLLDQLQDAGWSTSSGIGLSTLGDYSGHGAGTGNLDLIVYTGAGTKDRNLPVGPFEDPIAAPTGSPNDHMISNNYWGWDDRGGDGVSDALNGPVLVGDLLDYLHQFCRLNNTPVFIFDHNQTGSSSGLFVAAEVFIWHPDPLLPGGGARVATWAFDLLDGPVPGGLPPGPSGPGNDAFDEPISLPTDIANPLNNPPWVPSLNEQVFTGGSGTVYNVDNNLGSGTTEYYVYAPAMDLSLFDPTDLFVGRIYLANINDGFEELYLAGRVTPYVIPEPGTLALLCLGMASLLGYSWRRKRKMTG